MVTMYTSVYKPAVIMPDVCGKFVCKIVKLDLYTWQRVFEHSNKK